MMVNLNNRDAFYDLVDKIFDKSQAYKDFFENSKTMNVVIGREGKFLYVNKSWEKILGFTKEELCAVPFTTFIHPDDVKRTLDIYNRGVEGKPKKGEMITNRYIKKDGSYQKMRWISSSESKEKEYWLATAVPVSE